MAIEMATAPKTETTAAGTEPEMTQSDDHNGDQLKPKIYPMGWKLHALTAG
jgi:hypothetical protein